MAAEQKKKPNPNAVKQQRPASSVQEQSAIPRPPIEDMVATKLLRETTTIQRHYLYARAVYVLSGLLAFSIAANLMLALREPDIRYFATDTTGKIKELVALDQPIQSINEILNWSTDAITKSYTFSFANYRQELQAARGNFTTTGWDGFQKALQESGNLKAVVENMFVTTAVPRGAPVIVGEGLLDGRYAWRIEVPILVTYQSANTRTTQDLLVKAVVVRRSELEHPRGLGIAQIIAE